MFISCGSVSFDRGIFVRNTFSGMHIYPITEVKRKYAKCKGFK